MNRPLADFTLTRIDGSSHPLHDYLGKVLLIVNVASECGLTPQYAALQALYSLKRHRGFEILGFPANDFGGQEPGSNEEIAAFCQRDYAVEFPLYQKTAVTGPEQHPLFKALVAAQPEAKGDRGLRDKLQQYGIQPGPTGAMLWNFEKFVVSRDGRVVARFSPDVPPDAPEVLACIETALLN